MFRVWFLFPLVVSAGIYGAMKRTPEYAILCGNAGRSVHRTWPAEILVRVRTRIESHFSMTYKLTLVGSLPLFWQSESHYANPDQLDLDFLQEFCTCVELAQG